MSKLIFAEEVRKQMSPEERRMVDEKKRLFREHMRYVEKLEQSHKAEMEEWKKMFTEACCEEIDFDDPNWFTNLMEETRPTILLSKHKAELREAIEETLKEAERLFDKTYDIQEERHKKELREAIEEAFDLGYECKTKHSCDTGDEDKWVENKIAHMKELFKKFNCSEDK